jgi:DNA polymerase-3 subunit epsilon
MKHLNFALVRIECCNQYKDTPCRIALVGVKDSQIVEKKEFMVDPEDEMFEFMSSGTQLEELKGKGNFMAHWAEVYTFIREYPVLISTADGYDSDVLFNSIRKFHIDCESISYLTAKNILRRSISIHSYAFDYLCELLGVNILDGLPLNLAMNWCELIINACKDKEEYDLLDFVEKNKLVLGRISSEDYIKCGIKRIYKPRVRDEESLDESKFEKDHLFYEQNVVFTGKLQYFLRDDAEHYVEVIGGKCPNGLSKTTNYLVVGVQNPSQVGPDGLSEKQRKAIKYQKEGIDIELLSETEFIDIMGLQHVIDWRKYVDETFLAPLRK